VPESTNTVYMERRGPSSGAVDALPAGSVVRAANSPAAVELTGVARRLGRRWALRGVTLRVDPGEVVAIVGPNGSGKTTLLRVIGAALAPTRGAGRVFGRDLVDETDAVREVSGMLGHGTGLYDDLTAAENLGFALQMYGEAPSATSIDRALEAVGLREHASERVRALSSGMRRRVALARLVLRRPRLLLLDEPYNSFDAAGVAAVDALIGETARAGGAALVVTHDLGRSRRASYDRVVALEAGRVGPT
jgi:heme exporter protein A